MRKLQTILLMVVAMLAMANISNAQTATTSTTLSAAVADTQVQTLTVASATGFTAGTTSMFTGRELMNVTAVSGTTITVQRASSGRGSSHANAATVYVGPRGAASPFITVERAGSCTRTDYAYLPQIHVATGVLYDCETISGTWRVIGGPAYLQSQDRLLVSGSGATATLTTAHCGAVVLFDRAAGTIYTLPAPNTGCFIDFVATVSVTSNAYKVATATQGTDWILGTYTNFDIDSDIAAVGFTCNGTSHDNFSMNGSTTGGLLGTQFRLTAVSATIWVISGTVEGNGMVATSCATS